MSEIVECQPPRFLTSLVESSPNAKLLPTVLSVIAGSVDAISFLGLGGLFTAHVTGNLVILAAHLVSGGEAAVAPMLSVLGFVAALGLTRLLAVACSCCSSAFCPVRFRRSGRNEGDPCGHTRRLGSGRERTFTDLAERGAVNGGHDDQHCTFHDRCRRRDAQA
jgi:hypothetical protein